MTYSGGLDWGTVGEDEISGDQDHRQWRSSSRTGTVLEDGRVMTSKRAYQRALSILESELNRKDQWVYYPEKNRKAYEEMEKLFLIMGEDYARKLYLKYYSKDPSKDKIPGLVTSLVNNALVYLASVDLATTLKWLKNEGFDISGKARGCYRVRAYVTYGVLKGDPLKALDLWNKFHGNEYEKVYGWNKPVRIHIYGALAQGDFEQTLALAKEEVGSSKINAYRGIVDKMPDSAIPGFAPEFDSLAWTTAGPVTWYEAELGLWLERKLALRWCKFDPDAAIAWFSNRNPQEGMIITQGEYPDLREGRRQHLLYAWAVNHPQEVKNWAIRQQGESLYQAVKALGERNYQIVLEIAKTAATDQERMRIAKHALQRMETKLTKYDELYHMFRQDLVWETWWTVRKKINQSTFSEAEKKVLLDEVELHFKRND